MLHTDICIAGAGVIGLSLALELQSRNLSVTVIEAGQPLREASWAAAGMLAAQDPHNPEELSALSNLSAALYPKFLDRLKTSGSTAVPFQTSVTLQSITAGSPPPVSIDPATSPPPGFRFLDEHSIDPRQLGSSLLAAIAATPVRLLTESPVKSTRSLSNTVLVTTPTHTIEADHFVDCTGAWTNNPEYRVSPIKGQMLAVVPPSNLPLSIVVRTANIYIVPRTTGPNAGRAIIGATVEDVGFDKILHAWQIRDLHQQAAALLPAIAEAKVIDFWSGLRPATPDRLPLIGQDRTQSHHWVATGHYRNGILLAPATARVMAQLILGENTTIPIDNFSPSRIALRRTACR